MTRIRILLRSFLLYRIGGAYYEHVHLPATLSTTHAFLAIFGSGRVSGLDTYVIEATMGFTIGGSATTSAYTRYCYGHVFYALYATYGVLTRNDDIYVIFGTGLYV